MREIKFRVWASSTKRWIYPVYDITNTFPDYYEITQFTLTELTPENYSIIMYALNKKEKRSYYFFGISIIIPEIPINT